MIASKNKKILKQQIGLSTRCRKKQKKKTLNKI